MRRKYPSCTLCGSEIHNRGLNASYCKEHAEKRVAEYQERRKSKQTSKTQMFIVETSETNMKNSSSTTSTNSWWKHTIYEQ